MDAWDKALFRSINASADAPATIITLAVVIAQWAIFAVPLLLTILWLWGGRDNRPGVLRAFCGSEVALAFNQVINVLWYHPRPFAVPVGRTLIDHVNDSSFPSDHVTFMTTVGLGLLLWTARTAGWGLVLLLSVCVAWARLYLGVHFPIDMAGALGVAGAGVLTVAPFRQWVSITALPRFLEPLYRRVFAPALRRGWVQP